jgi:hypothetical protein
MVHFRLNQIISTLGSFIIFHHNNILIIPVARVIQCNLLSLDLLLVILSNFLLNSSHFNLTLLAIMLTLPSRDPRPLLEVLRLVTVVLRHLMLDYLPHLSLRANNMKGSFRRSHRHRHMSLHKMNLLLVGCPQRIMAHH